MTELERIIEVYGPDIEDRAKKVESRMVSPVGSLGFGYRVAHWEDIQQLAYETILTSGITLEDIENHPQPLGFLYDLCKNKGIAEAKKARAYGQKYNLTGFIFDDADAFVWVQETIPDRRPHPEDILIAKEFDRELREAVLKVLAKTGKLGMEVLELWVFHGFTAEEVSEAIGATYEATRVRIHRGLKKLSEDDVATLYAAREYLNPHAKRPKSIEGKATALLSLL